MPFTSAHRFHIMGDLGRIEPKNILLCIVLLPVFMALTVLIMALHCTFVLSDGIKKLFDNDGNFGSPSGPRINPSPPQ